MHRLLSITLLTLSVATPGCKTYYPAKFNRGVGLFGSTVLVVPFSELRYNMWYNESTRGALVAQSLKFWVTENHEAGFPDSYVEEQILHEVVDWTEEQISSEDWKKLVTGFGIDYVLVGDLTEIELRNPREVNLLNPTATARYRVIDAAAGKEVFRNTTTVARGNIRDEDFQIPSLDLGGDQAAVERELLANLSKRIGKELYGYYSKW